MADHVVSERGEVIRDPEVFPLLFRGGAEPFVAGGVAYPRSVAAGGIQPLFLGGVATDGEIARIAAGIAAHLARRHAGPVLLVQVLEGAIPFAAQVLEALARLGRTADLASVKVRSYGDGTRQSAAHQILSPLSDRQGRRIDDARAYAAVVLLDDLVDTGQTAEWLLAHYLPAVRPRSLEACFMLEKRTGRRIPETPALDEHNRRNGMMVPDVWVVGHGLDLALPGGLHLFRGELPGGIYAFNDALEGTLSGATHHDPAAVAAELGVYLGTR